MGADPVVPLIKSAEIDYSANVLTVLGANFGSSVSSVKFNGLSLVPAYNAAQTNEKRLFQSLLHDLCQTIQE